MHLSKYRSVWTLHAFISSSKLENFHPFSSKREKEKKIKMNNLWFLKIFLQSFYGYQDGNLDMQDLVLLQTFLGLSLSIGMLMYFLLNY